MQHRKPTIHKHKRISCFLLLSMLIASSFGLTAARHSRLDLSYNAKQAAAVANSTSSKLATEDKQHATTALGKYKPAQIAPKAETAAMMAAKLAPNDLKKSEAGEGSKLAEAEYVQSATIKDTKAATSGEKTVRLPSSQFNSSNATLKDESHLLQETKLLTNYAVDDEVEFFDNSLEENLDNQGNDIQVCDADFIGFEITTGYVFSAPGKMLHSLPGTLMLTDCLDACRKDPACHAVNYETGLCVLFSSNADKLPGALAKSQFPVFTLYAQKLCLRVRPCARAWSIDRAQGYKLNGYAKRTYPVVSRKYCLELCLSEQEFTCRSANYYRNTKSCELSEMDRITLTGTSAFQRQDTVDYLENNCVDEPNKLCEFKRLPGRILKTVDSVFQDISSIDECRDLCLNSPY
ncbi:PREDICTED: uncharacterized protein LOC108378693, partial [Rhagoletis zephyria]|uniref:uncharacterized protein LOC108378693 n=1 Tax=Rhagoletis zephyria TaxID=28612 RepID=UPI00081180FD